MPEGIRALIIIILLALIVFSISKKMFSSIIPVSTLNRWRNIWITVTLIAFLAHNFWLYIALTGFYLYNVGKREPNKIALFFLLLFIIPPIGDYIPGLGGLQNLFEITHPRLLSLVILLPAFIFSKSNTDSFKFGKTIPDKLLFIFLLISTILQLRDTTTTDTLRRGFYIFTDIFLPYYVGSRGLRSIQDIKVASIALVLASQIQGVIGVFEYVKHWLLYASLPDSLGIPRVLGNYMSRGGELRAMAGLAHPIIFGLIMVASIGFFLYISPLIKSKKYRSIGLLTLISGLLVSLSRGPWIGAVLLIISFSATGKNPIKRIFQTIIIGVLFIGMLNIIPGGAKYYNLLPYLGTTQSENIEYREKLVTNSMIVIGKYPIFGSANYLETPEMQEMIQGEGIIDVVNSYIGIALNFGYFGLSLFLGLFFYILLRIYKIMKKLPNKDSEEFLLGRCLLSITIAVLVIIATASSIGIIPYFYWTLAGIGVAYIQLTKSKVT